MNTRLASQTSSRPRSKATKTMRLKTLDAAIAGILFVGYGMPASAQTPSADKQPAAIGQEAVATHFSIDLPNGGMVWATEDPTQTTPVLSVQAGSEAAVEGGRIVEPVKLQVYSNYAAFIKRMQISIYRAEDTDLVTPLATVDIAPGGVVQATWDGSLPEGTRVRPGDRLTYILRATAADGSVDETYPRSLLLVSPADRQRILDQMHQNASGPLRALSASDLESRALLDSTFGNNALRQQNIIIRGSRVRVFGQNVPEGYGLTIDGQTVPVDQRGKFVAEYLLPTGMHRFAVDVKGPNGEGTSYPLDINVRENYLFIVAIADLTMSKSSISGDGASGLTVDDRYRNGFLDEGRLAFYTKGKVDGRYLFTAQADTTERNVGNLFDGLFKADPRDVFRRLDPNMYYPVYGDDSTTYRDIDTQGKLYLRVDWDKSQALWGNYQTGFTGTQYAQYVRSLYGAAVDWRSRSSTPLGDPSTQVKVFASQAQTVAGHSEFLGTGGSLYYLRHTDLLPGSDQLVLEVRDPSTGSVVNRISLVRGIDYDINEMQGRIMMTKPLAQIADQNTSTLFRDRPTGGYENHLLADYEYVPSGFDSNNVTGGVRAKHWFGEHVAVGGTYVSEGRSDQAYTLKGVDATLQAGRGTYLKMEHSQTQAAMAPIFYSDNGGLSFMQINPQTQTHRSGNATAIEGRANLRELGWTSRDWTVGAWWRDVSSGYSVARADLGYPVREYGFEYAGQVREDIRIAGRYSKSERGTDALEQAQAQIDWRLAEHSDLIAEIRRVTETYQGNSGTGTLAALGYTRRLIGTLDVYGTGQITLDDDGGAYPRNNAATVGAKYQFANQSSAGAEYTAGNRGNAAKLTGEYRMSPDHSLYGNYTRLIDSTGVYDQSPLLSPAPSSITLGQRWRISNTTNLYNETQSLKSGPTTGVGHTFGMDFYPARGWTTGFSLQQAELDAVSGAGKVHRQAASVNVGLTQPGTTWASKLEYRSDEGAEQRRQWVSANRVGYEINESLRLGGRFNWANTSDANQPVNDARYTEASLGFAWRPWNSVRWTVIGKYTYLYNLASAGQVDGSSGAGLLPDQRSSIWSLEGIYRLDANWEFAAKLATRTGEARLDRGSGDWYSNRATLMAGQVRRYVYGGLSAMGEYRVLRATDGGTRQGWLASVDYDVAKHVRLGVGYNFTRFSDDMAKPGYRYRGWFVNAVMSI